MRIPTSSSLFGSTRLNLRINLRLKRLAGLTLLLSAWPALAALNLSTPIPVNPDLTVGTLPNGLRYYIQRNEMPRQKVELRLVVKAGSVLEDDDQQGLAHFTEHMAFNGSRHFKKHELISYLQSIGVKFGADLNAYTSFDETVYVLPIPTDKEEYLPTGMQVLADWAQGVTMKDEDIDKERPIILEEARLGKGVGDRISKQLLPEVLNGSKYAKRLPIGQEEIIKGFKYDALRRFYKDWYRPDLMAVVVVGDVAPAEAEKMIRTYFSDLKNPQPERPRPEIAMPKNTATKALVITDKEASNNMLMLRYPLEKQPEEKVIGDYRRSALQKLYQSMLGVRLGNLTQQANPPYLGASAATEPVVNGYQAFVSYAVLSPAGTSAAITALIQEKNRVRQFGFSADELERAKKNLARSYESMFNERDKSASSGFAAEYIRNFLHDEPIPGIKNEYLYLTEFAPGITLEEMNQFARSATPDDTTKLVFYVGSGKTGEHIPANTDLLAMAQQAEQQTLQASIEKPVAASLMTTPPTAGSIVSETVNKALDLTELTLSNGVKVTLKKTDFKNDQVLLGAQRFGGVSLFSPEDKFNAWYANSIAWDMGVGNFSKKDIPLVLAGKRANVNTSIGDYTESFGASSSSNDMEEMLQLLYLRMTSPRKDETLYRTFIASQKELARNNMATPESVFWDTVKTVQYGEHPRMLHPPKAEDFDHVSMERSMEIFQQRFGSAKDLHFFIVGSFDIAKLRPLIATYLASLPVGEIKTGFEDMHFDPLRGVIKKDVHVGHEDKSIVSLSFTGPATYSREESSRFHALIDILNLKVVDVLREKQSLIYSGSLSGSISRIPHEQYSINGVLPCSPANVDKVVAALFAEIEKIQQSGPQAEDLDKIKQTWLKSYRESMRDNNSWLNHLEYSALYNDDPANRLDTEKRINALTPEQIQDAAKRYFNFQNYVQVVMYPEEKKKQE